MHKKLASDLTSLAHSILKMKNKDEVFALKQKAYEVYEKLSVLAYVEEYINNTPHPTKTKEELLQDVALAFDKKIEEEVVVNKVETPIAEEEKIVHHLEEDNKEEIDTVAEEIAEDVIEDIVEEKIAMKMVEEIIEQPFDEIQEMLFGDDDVKNDVKDVGEKKTATLEEELQDTLPVDVMANLFEKAEPKKTLNDHLQSSIQIGLNDRIAFVKHLFDGDQADFNRVISQLNTFKTEKEAKKFINKMVKPDYDWSEKEEYEARLLEIIERKFA
ncbi:hypothetical protein WH52_13075 [Tenacibaculum holothuriorum]|uniref:Uncharacterized protein n=1 Tax=Tenacibaculum holothuriorum TaxID=1635173 RepID=A0A1Y2PBR2_9FLAO|nr:hypothetical protein [Tenacibaculum holothuriorum]OSY87189.1 hypothetical protein WH52_13075 [Tenacibaculum holothuriorum]